MRKQDQSVSSAAQSCPTLCDPMNCSTPGLPVHHQLTHIARNSWGAFQNNDLSEPRLLHLLIHRKALNPLRYLAFFKSNLLMLQLPCLPCKISYIFCPYPLQTLSTTPSATIASQSYLSYCVLGSSPQFCLLDKTTLNFHVVLFFFTSQQLKENFHHLRFFPIIVIHSFRHYY